MDSVRYWNVQMEKSGICLRVLRKNNQKALIYVCRRLQLERRFYNNGKNFQFSGMWKVYGDRDAAEKRFKKYKKCTDIYLRLWNNGRSVRQLTVAA